MKIDFVSDISCPWCAIGLNALEQAVSRLGDAVTVNLHFQPFELNPQMPAEGEEIVGHLSRKYGLTPEQCEQNAEMIRERVMPHARFKGEANVMIMPNLDAANIAYQFTKILADALPVGPILMGARQPAHILTPSITARGIVNMTAVAVAEAQAIERREQG